MFCKEYKKDSLHRTKPTEASMSNPWSEPLMQILCKNGLSETDIDIDESGKTIQFLWISPAILTLKFLLGIYLSFHLDEFHRYLFCYLACLKKQMEQQKTLPKGLVSLTYIKWIRFPFRIILRKKLLKETNYIFRPLTDYWLFT